jgi:phytoene dehydrogenase-like protein
VAAYTVSLLNPKVIRDLDLPRHGLRVVERRLSNFLPLEDNQYLKVGGGKTEQEVGKFSQRDAVRLTDYAERLDVIADVLRDLVLETPPNVTAGSWLEALPELLRSAKLGKRIARLDMAMRRELLDLFVKSAGDYLDTWFESAPIKAAYGFDGIVGNYASPYAAGSAYVLLHHVFGEVNGKKGAWGHAIGGMGAISQAMAKAAAERGVEIRVSSPVREVIVESGRAVGVVLEDGAHAALALRLGHRPHERRLERTAGFHRAAGQEPRRPSHVGHHHGAEPGLHGPGVPRCQGRRLVQAAHRRDADSLDA